MNLNHHVYSRIPGQKIVFANASSLCVKSLKFDVTVMSFTEEF